MSGILRWEDPPTPDKRGARNTPRVADWYRIAAQLRDQPGRWAAICESTSTTTPAQIRQGTYRAFLPAGTFDAVGRRVNGTYTVYARYVGGAS